MSKETIYIVGYPKSGNGWLARLVGDALNSPVDSKLRIDQKPAICDEGFNRPGNYIIKQNHKMLPPNDGKVIYIYRDPRDVAVSVSHYWERSLKDTIVSDSEHPPRMLNPYGGWCAFMTRWMFLFEADARVSYEKLLSNTESELKRILLEIDATVANDIKAVVERQSFATKRKLIQDVNAKGYSYGMDVQMKNMRKGISGDWKNHFTKDVAETANDYWWPWLQYLGYEENSEWWRKI